MTVTLLSLVTSPNNDTSFPGECVTETLLSSVTSSYNDTSFPGECDSNSASFGDFV